MTRFHLAFPVKDITSTRQFYCLILGCTEGRSAERWIDFDFHGHQLSAHVVDRETDSFHNAVDTDQVPIPHFGVILDFAAFEALAARLEDHNISFIIPPKVRFAGEPGEQRTMFFEDPSGNTLEIKAFADDQMVYTT